jgi:hypothetical protein
VLVGGLALPVDVAGIKVPAELEEGFGDPVLLAGVSHGFAEVA